MKSILKTLVILFVLFMGGVLYVLSHQIGGFRAFIVSSGSMEPTISTGSLIITKYTHPTLLQKGDVITFIAPIKEREFVTHRIVQIGQKDSLTVIKTKGDHNQAADNWVLAGGGVVGKELVAIPFLGYVFSFTQTKLGILFVILIPSMYIIYSELEYVFRHVSKKPAAIPTAPVAGLLVGLCLSSLTLVPRSSALLSGQVSLTHNTFAVVLPSVTPTPTIVPSPIPSGCDITISNNAPGSVNTVTCTRTTTTVTNQNSNTNVVSIINQTSNNGGNVNSGN